MVTVGKLELNRLWSVTSIFNNRVISSLEASGFEKEGIMRNYLRNSDGQFHNIFLNDVSRFNITIITQLRLLSTLYF